MYKLAAIKNKEDADFVPKIKLSENVEKVTNPGNKTIMRIYDKTTGKIRADLICLEDDDFNPDEDMILFDPMATWKKTKLTGGSYILRELLVPVFKKGECVYTSPVCYGNQRYLSERAEHSLGRNKTFHQSSGSFR